MSMCASSLSGRLPFSVCSPTAGFRSSCMSRLGSSCCVAGGSASIFAAEGRCLAGPARGLLPELGVLTWTCFAPAEEGFWSKLTDRLRPTGSEAADLPAAAFFSSPSKEVFRFPPGPGDFGGACFLPAFGLPTNSGEVPPPRFKLPFSSGSGSCSVLIPPLPAAFAAALRGDWFFSPFPVPFVFPFAVGAAALEMECALAVLARDVAAPPAGFLLFALLPAATAIGWGARLLLAAAAAPPRCWFLGDGPPFDAFVDAAPAAAPADAPPGAGAAVLALGWKERLRLLFPAKELLVFAAPARFSTFAFSASWCRWGTSCSRLFTFSFRTAGTTFLVVPEELLADAAGAAVDAFFVLEVAAAAHDSAAATFMATTLLLVPVCSLFSAGATPAPRPEEDAPLATVLPPLVVTKASDAIFSCLATGSDSSCWRPADRLPAAPGFVGALSTISCEIDGCCKSTTTWLNRGSVKVG
mmetsp:Transcript_7619/g.18389  ORF Transcript_7619/g.18389 Transcript_7619/m.18389 type:complete len:469 (-) Transcript_7619:146-1552(-)